jgi:hypothetical protein
MGWEVIYSSMFVLMYADERVSYNLRVPLKYLDGPEGSEQ